MYDRFAIFRHFMAEKWQQIDQPDS